MASPIPLELPKADPRLVLQERLADAPAAHAEAMLAAYEVLQGLHDRGVLDLARGALGSGDKVLEVAVAAAQAPASIRGIRNLLLLLNMLGSIDPDVLKAFTQGVPHAFQLMLREPQRPGLWRLIQDFFWNHDFRRGMAALNTLLEAFGHSLSVGDRTNANPAPPR
jgi:uncharacterized protein YjgD (DUF1641 family)